MTSVAPVGEGDGGGGPAASSTSAAGSTTTTTEQAPSPAAPTAQPSTAQQQQQHPPPSPLSGCYLLVVLPEPHTAQHKDLILNRLAKGFLSWDKDSCHVDLEKELHALVLQSPEGEEARNGERLIQYATENLVTEVLIYPQSNTLLQCIRNLLASFTKHRHIIHAGYTFGGNGSWILQDGTFSLADFLDAFSEHEVQRVLRAYENSVTVDIHCAGVGDWTTSRLSKEACTRACRVRVNPDDVLTAGVPAITSFVGYIGQYLIPQTLDQLMEPSDVVGNIRFTHPTLYVFPGGQGDAALFGINGFNMLVDGGFARKSCFWDFVRHLDRLDAVLVTRINNSNVGGMSSVIRKKKEMHVYPQIGHFFCNLVERKHSNSPDGDKDIDPLILNLIDVGQEMVVNLRHINLRPHPCYRDPEPINLYHKVGHGTLDMYVLSPSKDSREVREFMSKWNASDSKLFAGSHRKDSSGILFPVQNLVSICALLVWQPANPEDTITRILFPGSTPQHKIFEGFERLKHLEFLKRPVCTAKSLSPSTSLATLKEKAAILKPKLGSIERETKRLAEMRREKRDLSENKAVKKDSGIDDATAKIAPPKPAPPVPQQKTESKAKKVVENKKIESESKESKLIENGLKEAKKEIKKVEKSEETKKTDIVKVENEKTAPVKELKTQKVEAKKKEVKETTKPISKPTRPDSTMKISTKPAEKKPKPGGEKKDIMKPSPTTPKKSINGAATKTEVSKTVTKNIKVTSKTSSTGPAKSAKDANNRMVVEQKNNELSSKSAIDSKTKSKTTTATTATTERKPVPRRTKPLSPNKARLSISPSKSAKSTPSSIKSEKDAVIRKIRGGTTDSSAVSTPSGIDIEPAHKLIDRNLTEKSEDMSLDSIESKVLADLKEEREVVEEIEAVLQKAERIEGSRKQFGRDDMTAERADKKDDDATEEDVTAEMDDAPKKISRKESQELTEEDEYLIVEKEEIYTEDSVQSGDAEQKHHLDEVESEKTRILVEHPPEESEHEDEKDVDEKKDEIPEKKLVEPSVGKEGKKSIDLSPENKEILEEEMKQIIASATEAIQKTEEKDDSPKKDSEDITKEASSSPEKFDSPGKQDGDQKELIPEKLTESQERISTLESGATTTAPTLPDDERVPLDEIKEELEKHASEEVKEKELVQEREVSPEIPPTAPKPEVKVLDVKPPLQGIARDIVKTPDEVADLPVHEEVDPKLYRLDDLDKDKDVKISPQEIKESPKEKDRGVFSFFGKVADKFEKGIDKLTKKGRRDSQKDTEDKSSKSSSPKEPKPKDQKLFEDIAKASKVEEAVGSLEKAKHEISDAITDIDATTALLQKDIKDFKAHELDFFQPTHHDHKPVDVLEEEIKKEVSADIQEVETLMEEASKKFKNVKDSLQDSLESLEDKVEGAKKVALEEKDTVKDMLAGVAEKLEDIVDIDNKEPEKVKFAIPQSEDFEEDDDDSGGIVRDFKEAVRDVAEVLIGTTGIEIEKEEKPKDVEEIVKKVAEVLKEDDLLSEKALTTSVPAEVGTLEDIAEKAALSKAFVEETATDVKEQIEEFLRKESTEVMSQPRKMSDDHAAIEEPFTKAVAGKQFVSSPVKHDLTDLEEAKILCADLLKDDNIVTPIVELQADPRVDVMELGIEEVCVKEVAKREIYEEKDEDEDNVIVEPEISFQQNLSPGKAELVTVTPGSTPTSPKFATEAEFADVSPEHKNMINKDSNLEYIIEDFIVQKKYKITMNIIEYIVIVKRVPKKKVINVIQEIIIKHKIPRESVVDRVEILRLNDDIPTEKRTQIENDITNEYLNAKKRINSSIVDEIARNHKISKRIVIEIIEEIIVRNKLPRESVFDISDESYFTIIREDVDKVPEKETEKQDVLTDVSSKIDSVAVTTESTHMPTGAEEIDDKIVDGFVSISSKDSVEAFVQQEKETSQHDGFEAVEQEYKVKDDASAISPKATTDDQKAKDTEELTESVSEVMEVDEKFVRETVEKNTKKDDLSEDDSKIKALKKEEEDPCHDADISEVSEADTKEKYLDEAKEKTSDEKEHEKLFESVNIAQPISSSAVDHTKPLNDEKDSQESTSVKRMVVTASSEDGGQETEICPSGTITFTKAPTLEDTKVTEIETRKISISTTHAHDTAQSPDSLQSGDASPAESVFSKSPTEKTSPHDFESTLTKEKSSISASENVFHQIDKTVVTESIFEKDVQHKEALSDLHSPAPIQDTVTEDSKSPSEVKAHDKELSSEKPDDVVHIQHETEPKDRSKSPSVEKETIGEEVKTDDVTHVTLHEVDVKDRSKSPSAEKESHSKEASPEKTIDADLKEHPAEIKDRSKSPSAEKDLDDKELSPEKSIAISHLQDETADKSKSPSVEKELRDKEASPKKSVDAGSSQFGDKSKSPSAEREPHDKEALPAKSVDRSKSPSAEKEASPEKSIDGSKSPSAERESHEKEASPAKSVDRSKSPSAEKEASPGKSIDGSKSPGAEIESHEKEASPVKSIDTTHDNENMAEIKDGLKSPSKEKETLDKEEIPAKSQETDIIIDKSKSPSVEKDISEKSTDGSQVKSEETDIKDRSKSPSAEKDSHVKPKTADLRERSISPSTEKESHDKKTLPEKDVDDNLAKLEDKDKVRSKSPSVEKETHDTAALHETPADTTHVTSQEIETKDRSKSPSPEKISQDKEPSPEKSIDDGLAKTEAADIKDRSISPSAEKEPHDKEISSEKHTDADLVKLEPTEKDRSKSPSVEKETHGKEASHEKPTDAGHATTQEIEIKDRSKSPSVEKDSHEKKPSLDKPIDDGHAKSEAADSTERSIPPSAEKEPHDKETSPEKHIDPTKLEPAEKDRSKSPSVEKETHEKEASQEIPTDASHVTAHEIEIKDRSKSPSVEKDLHEKEPSLDKSIDDGHAKSEAADPKERSISPSAEKQPHDKETSPEKHVDADLAKVEPSEKDRSKSPSVEKETHEKEASHEISVDASHVKAHETEITDKSKSPGVEKDSHEKEPSPEKSIDDGHAKSEAADPKERSVSPSAEKEPHDKETTPEKHTDADVPKLEPSEKDRSKSPSVEKETHEKEASHEKPIDAGHATTQEVEIKDESKSPSEEKDSHEKEPSPEKSIDDGHVKSEAADLISPSHEKEPLDKEILPEKHVDADLAKVEPSEKDRSKSPSVEKETHEKEASHEISIDASHVKAHETDITDKSKSPSVEKDSHEKEPSPEKSIDDGHAKSEAADPKESSVSPSAEKEPHDKETTSEKHTDADVPKLEPSEKDRSKSPSVEKETHEKEASHEKPIDAGHATTQEVEIKDRSKSPSVEKDSRDKEPSPEKSIEDGHAKSEAIDLKEKSVSSSAGKGLEEETSLQQLEPKDKDRSKSPSVEKETHEKEVSQEQSTDVTHGLPHEIEVKDRSKSSSVERETQDKEKPVDIGHVQHETVADKSKSPSVEKEVHEKEKSPEKSVDDSHVKPQEVDMKDRSKSPSAEREMHGKEPSSEKSADADNKQDEAGLKDKSKSPSLEKETHLHETSVDATHVQLQEIEIKDRSISPSVEKELPDKEASPEKTKDLDHVHHETEDKDKSKSPSIEKDLLEKSIDSAKEQQEVTDRSKSPSVEKETNVKQDTIDFLHSEKSGIATDKIAESKSLILEKEVAAEKLPSTKSPTPEPEIGKKESSPEKSVTDRKQSTADVTDRSRSSSIVTDSFKKESTPDKHADVAGDKSKSHGVEPEISHHESTFEATITQTEVRSKSPSVEKDASRRDSVSKKEIDDTKQLLSEVSSGQHEDASHSSSIIADVSKDSEPSSKSRSGSVQSVIDHGASLSTSDKDKLKDEKSRTGSISESVTSEARAHGSKSPSPEKVDVISEQFSDTFMEKGRLSLVSDKFDEDSLDRTKSPSVLSDKSDEKDAIDRSKSPSVVGDKFDVGQTDDAIKDHSAEEKPKSPILSGTHDVDKTEIEKSKSVSPVGEKIHTESIVDRKTSVSSIEGHSEEKGKDRSRSHSLFDTGDKTPLVRSRAASLYDDKLVDKVSSSEHRKDSTAHGKDIFEEEHEFRSSHETLDDIHRDITRRDSKEPDSLSAETKQAIENYILNEYIRKNKVITLECINEVTTIYKVDRYVVIKIVNELITNNKLKQEKIAEVDADEHDEANEKLLDVEENLMNYINEEFVSKKKKISSKIIDDIASSKSVPRPLVILVIENIILSRNLPRESVVDFDLSESQDILKKDMGADDPAGKTAPRKASADIIPEKLLVDDTVDRSKRASASPEPGLAKSESPHPCMHEQITISENKREEIESLIVDDYVDRGIKINEAILENIIARTSIPKYIIVEIIQEIILKKLLSKNVVVDDAIFSDDDVDDPPQKLEYGESSHSEQYGEHRLDKSMPYTEYESPFHKAFMEGMTEIRTTHITTLSGKSTPDFGQREGIAEPSSDVTSTITRTVTSIPGKSEHERQDNEDETDRIVILKTTQITTYPEDEQEIIKEFVQRQSLSGPSEMQKIEEEPESRAGPQELLLRTDTPSSIGSLIELEDSGHEYTEIVTTKIVKTIITETEMDPVTKITKIVSEIPSETTTTTTHSKITTESKSSQETMVPATTSESQASSTSKTIVSSTIVDSEKSTPDIKHEEHARKVVTGLTEHTLPEQMEQSVSPVIRDLICDDRSYSGKSSPDVSLPKDIAYGDSTGKSTPELSMSPLVRDGSMIQSHFSGRSTPDRRSDNRSRTATPEGFRSGEVIRTIITTTRTISDDGEFITTTQEVTETTNEKGETVVLATKTDVKVDEPPPESLLVDVKAVDAQRTSSPGSEKDKDPTSPRSDLSSGHSRAATHMWESSEERHTYSDEDPSSPLFSSSPHQPDPRQSIKEETSKTAADFSSSAMSSSFYGQLPEEVAHFTSTITKITESHPEQDFTFRKLTVEKEYAGGYAEKDSKKYVDDADLDFEKALTAAAAAATPSSSQELSKSGDSKPGDADGKKDPLAGWGSPLKLPSPKAPRKFNLRSPIQPTSSADLSPDSLNFDVINDWGEPMRLPSPAPTANELSNKGSPGTPKKDRDQARKVMSENMKNKKRSESPNKHDKKYKNAKNKVQPIYVDLTYVSHHGNSFYTALDFFKKIRARYYVFSGTEPSREVYDALLEAKKTWEDKDLEVTLIPTYDTDTLGYWVADNEEALAANHIDLSPSASRCTINLQDHETSCSAYRLEF